VHWFKATGSGFWQNMSSVTGNYTGNVTTLQSAISFIPTALFSSLMLSSGTMTRQTQQLENRGLIERLPNPADARSMLVQLSSSGFSMMKK
jgi:DNA-binding MarR family transcriptional regulator